MSERIEKILRVAEGRRAACAHSTALSWRGTLTRDQPHEARLAEHVRVPRFLKGLLAKQRGASGPALSDERVGAETPVESKEVKR